MNSLLQQLFMLPSFRKSIIEYPISDPRRQELLFQLKVVFGVLQEKVRPAYNATPLCGLIKDFDESPLSIYEQKDVDEFYNLFLDRLERCFDPAGSKLLFQSFGGAFANEIVCGGCGHHTDRRESFLSISLLVKGKKRLEESLESFIEAEDLEGKNAYFCDSCKKSCKARKRVLLKELPNALVVVLKRFSYDTCTMFVRYLHTP